jgi:hypothetical protein
MSDKMTQEDYNKKAAEMAKSNHMWISAFACINPTDELKTQIGAWVLKLLRDEDNLMPSESITSENKTVRELAELTPVLYLMVNKS